MVKSAAVRRLRSAAILWAVLTALGLPGSSSTAADLATIRDRGQLIVAVKSNTPPLGFVGEDGVLRGLEIDIARQLAQVLLGDPNAVTLVPTSNTERIPALLRDEVDVVIARLSVTEQRARLVDFSRPYYYDGTALITKAPELRQFTDIGLRPVAVLTGSDTIDDLRWHLPQATLVGLESYQAAYELLETGEAIAFAADASLLTGWTQRYPEYRMLPTLLSAEGLSIAMLKGLQYQPLQAAVDDAMDVWYATGWLQERIAHWGLPLDDLERLEDPESERHGEDGPGPPINNLNESGTL
ncbi:MAG: transporter substrate-binding domain-containing protein, partial [Cyanobacteria bacterium P01_A01_bin.135]